MWCSFEGLNDPKLPFPGVLGSAVGCWRRALQSAGYADSLRLRNVQHVGWKDAIASFPGGLLPGEDLAPPAARRCLEAGPLPFLQIPVSAAVGRAGYVQTSGEAGTTVLLSEGQMPEAVLNTSSVSAQSFAQAVLLRAAARTEEAALEHAWQESSWLLSCFPFPILCFSGPVAVRLCWPVSPLKNCRTV